MPTIHDARRRFGWSLLPIAFIALAGATIPTTHFSANAQVAAPSVRLTIDYGDGVQKVFTSLPWRAKMTVFEALQAAEKHPRGIKLAFTGRGETIFITAIDDAMNEGAGGRNWRYRVNDQPAQSSAGVIELNAGDGVAWRYGD